MRSEATGFLGFWSGFGVEAVQENPSNIPLFLFYLIIKRKWSLNDQLHCLFPSKLSRLYSYSGLPRSPSLGTSAFSLSFFSLYSYQDPPVYFSATPSASKEIRCPPCPPLDGGCRPPDKPIPNHSGSCRPAEFQIPKRRTPVLV